MPPPRPIIVLAGMPQGSFQVATRTAAILGILSENVYTLGISMLGHQPGHSQHLRVTS